MSKYLGNMYDGADEQGIFSANAGGCGGNLSGCPGNASSCRMNRN